MKRLTILTLAILSVSLVLPASGQVPRLEFRFDQGSGVGSNGVQVGGYTASLVSMPGRPPIDIYCVDFLNSIRKGQVWTANVSSMGGDLGYTRFGNGNRANYQKAAWLSLQFQNTDQSQWGGLHSAIWNLMTPGSPSWGTANQAYWWGLANANYQTVDLSDWTIITDVNALTGGGVQEFITPNTITPEPVTMVLLSSGLAGVGLFHRRRRNAVSK